MIYDKHSTSFIVNVIYNMWLSFIFILIILLIINNNKIMMELDNKSWFICTTLFELQSVVFLVAMVDPLLVSTRMAKNGVRGSSWATNHFETSCESVRVAFSKSSERNTNDCESLQNSKI